MPLPPPLPLFPFRFPSPQEPSPTGLSPTLILPFRCIRPFIYLSDSLHSYKIGDSFVNLPLSEVQELLAAASAKIEVEVESVQERLSEVRGEMSELKVQLYARFGRSINLET